MGLDAELWSLSPNRRNLGTVTITTDRIGPGVWVAITGPRIVPEAVKSRVVTTLRI
jgi:hypothetical protein